MNSQMKRYMGQGPEGSQAQEPLSCGGGGYIHQLGSLANLIVKVVNISSTPSPWRLESGPQNKGTKGFYSLLFRETSPVMGHWGPPPCYLISINSGGLEPSLLWLTKNTPITQEIQGFQELSDCQERGKKTRCTFYCTAVGKERKLLF